MKILFFCKLFYPHIGGVEKHVLEISKVLKDMGYKVMVITERYSDDLPRIEEVNGIKIRRISVGENDWFKKFRIWRELLKLRSVVKSANLIHCHDVFFWYFPFLFLYPRKKAFVTFHGYEDYPIPKKAILIRRISEKLSSGNICVGDFMKKWYGVKPDFVTYGGVVVNKVQNSKFKIRNKFKIQNSKLKILFIGRLEEDMGIQIYLKALKKLKEKRIDFEFKACGDGKLRKKVEKYGKVYGYIEDVDSFIEKTNIVFASSYLCILEALKNKKLVFSVYNNALKEDYLKMAPFAPFIVIAKNSKTLANKLYEFIKNPKEKERLIYNGHRWSRMKTWNEVVSLYLHLWR